MVSVLRPGQRILNIPGYGVTTSRRAVASAAALGLIDTFTAADGTALTSHTPDSAPVGAAWSSTYAYYDAPAALTINGNAAYQAKSGIHVGFAFIETGLANCVITANMRTIGGPGYGGSGIVFRATGQSDYWFVDLVTGSSIRIMEVTSGAGTARASTAYAYGTGTDYQIVITLSGNSISATAAGQTASYSSSVRATATKHGIMSVCESAASYSKTYDITVA